MRKIARVTDTEGRFQRLMLFTLEGGGTFLFFFESLEDGPCDEDRWYESATDAESAAKNQFGVTAGEWQEVPDPIPGCQDDWLAPTRVKRDANGQPLWGQFETLPGSSA